MAKSPRPHSRGSIHSEHTGKQLPPRAPSQAESVTERSCPAELPAQMKAAWCHPPTAPTAPAGPPGGCLLPVGMRL